MMRDSIVKIFIKFTVTKNTRRKPIRRGNHFFANSKHQKTQILKNVEVFSSRLKFHSVEKPKRGLSNFADRSKVIVKVLNETWREIRFESVPSAW